MLHSGRRGKEDTSLLPTMGEYESFDREIRQIERNFVRGRVAMVGERISEFIVDRGRERSGY